MVLITGASSGIGAALARVFAGHGHAVVLAARRKSRLKALADEIAAAGHKRPVTIAVDLAARNGVARLARELAARRLEPAIVVNNAAFGLYGQANDLDHAQQLMMIDLNARTLTDLSLRWVASLARHKGGILNVASVTGFVPGPGMATYSACKAYVISLSEALHGELKPSGIKVSALCPGPVLTEFQARAGIRSNHFPRFMMRSAERVAREGYDGLMAGKRIIVPGFHNKAAIVLARILPHSIMRRLSEISINKPARRGG